MEAHYTYLDNIWPQVGEGAVTLAAETQKSVTAVFVAALFILLGASYVRRRALASAKEGGVSPYVIPSRRPSFFGILDFFMETFVSYHDSVAGKQNRKYVPFTASIFFFILALNVLGLIPGMPAATTTVWLNVAMAIVVFVYFNVEGMKEHGVVNYMKHFLGPLWWMAPMMLVIEMVSLFMRILTLNLRLYWNINADHIVLGIFTDMLPTGMAAPFYVLGFFVSFMQAFVFATLTMVYIVLATQHEEGAHH
ncbi:ATP synthase F0 subunit A [bacterium]|nr:ATP synthase F0 subunit A [bacterium]